MTGAVYFPAIEPPDPTWLARCALYWESVAVVVPDAGTPEIEQFLRRSDALLRTGLAARAFPGDVHTDFAVAFAAYLEQLDPAELEHRRACFRAGQVTPLYHEKFLYRVLPQQTGDLGLAEMHPASEVVTVETTTAREWMSAVVLGLCHPRSYWAEDVTVGEWVPVTGTVESFQALCQASATRVADRPQMRIKGSLTRAELRTTALNGVLPVPLLPNAYEVASFRDTYGEVLINMREDLERRVDAALQTQEGEPSHAAAAQLVADLRPQIDQAQQVLRVAGWHSLTALTLAVATKVAADDAATASSHVRLSPGYEAEALAYVLVNGGGWQAQVAIASVAQRPITAAALGDPATVDPPAATPKWEIVALHDHAIPTKAEFFMAHRAHTHVVTANSGHDVPAAAPAVVDNVILQAAQSAG
jgi:hypothetical protein